MIRLLYEDEATPLDIPSIYGGDFHKDIKLYNVVKYAGFEWFVIEIKNNIVTLLAKKNFGESEFSPLSSTNYKTSKIMDRYLESSIPSRLDYNEAKLVPTDLPDVDCYGEEVWLLSLDEAEKLPLRIRQFDDWWWLRTPGNFGRVAIVSSNGTIYDNGELVYRTNAVRPAIRVHMKDLV